MKYAILLLAVFMTACGKPIQDPPAPRAVNQVWKRDLVAQSIDLSMADLTGATPSMLLVTHDTGAGKTVCWMTAFFRGDEKSGTLTLENPGLLVVKPMGSDGSPCYWLADVTGYRVIGTQLTITLDGGQAPLTFQ